VRRYLGDQDYKVETIATADDVEDANGVDVLDFWASSRGCPEAELCRMLKVTSSPTL